MPPNMVKSPFKFLDSYTISDRDIFFGRDQEITDLYRKVFESKILLVYGVSGTGKSSLINCGLASRFDESDWLPVNVRRGNHIIESLEDAINKQAISPLKKSLTITEKLQSVYLDHFKPVYLVFDQFEELFIFGSAEERKEFIKLMNEIVRSKTHCRIIIVIREEFLAGITEFEEKLPEIFSNRFRVEKMKRANAIIAVEGPCRVYNIKTEKGFSEELIDKLCPSGNEIELTFLQIYLDRIFRIALTVQKKDQEFEFSKEILTKSGSVSDLLGQFLEEKIKEMENPDTGMAILKSFVSVQGTRRQMTEVEILDSLGAFGTVISKTDLLKYLAKFVDLRILRERDEVGHFELRHDALASKIFEKFTAIEKDIIEVRQFIENAYSAYEKRGKLFTEDDLKYIDPYEDKLFLNSKLKQFLIDSKNFHTRSRRRRRRILAGTVIIIFFILTFFAGWALNERKKAVDQSKIADDQKIAAVNARDDAIKAQNEAIKSRKEAVSSKDDALYQKALADSALKVAENHRRISEQQKQRAEDLYVDANKQRQLAQESQNEAEKSAMEVMVTSKRAMYQLYLFNAKEFANKSLLMEKNDTIKALLALNAYDLVINGFQNYSSKSDSLSYEITILEALQKAYAKFESNILTSGEIWALDSKKGDIVFSDTLGRILITRLEEQTDDKLPELKTIKSIILPDNSFIRSLAIDNTKDKIACGTSEGDVILLTHYNNRDLDLKEIYKHDKRVLSLLFISDKNWLVSASLDNTVRIWDLSKEDFIIELQVENAVKNLVLYNDKIIYSDDKGGIFTWNINKLAEKPILIYQNKKPINALAINLLHNWLAAASGSEIILFPSILDINLKTVPKIFSVRHTGIISTLKFSPDNRWLSSVGFDGSILLWDINEGVKNGIENTVPIISGNINLKILSLDFDEHSKYLIYADNENLQLYPINLEVVYQKLKAKMGKRIMTSNEWDYYKRGDIQFESTSTKLKE
jgi:WD40 repeat protein/energy-coupling factor transporter ATP-binding protein EcfA2